MISVVIPTHKRGDIVVKAVESVINSFELPEEIIVVEDRICVDLERETFQVTL